MTCRPSAGPTVDWLRTASWRWLYYNSSVAQDLLAVLWNSAWITLRALWRVARQVFHEASGTLFAIFALYGGLAIWRQWKSRPVAWIICLALVYTAMMAGFSFAAFRRARRVR